MSAAKRQKLEEDNEAPTYELYKKISDFLLSKTKYRPKLFIVCGTGLGSLADMLVESEVNNMSSCVAHHTS
eukprot:m.81918 g.81918  ORF g.81918 m.81918 type:complete len:71 (+) comp12838_c1_seq1:111-323(+)